jgi:hypothetical protein
VEDLQAAAEERQRITAKDILLPHELTPEQLETVRTALNEFPDVKVAYMARKHVDWEQSQPFFLVGIERRRQMLKPESKNADAMLIHRLAQECALPFDAYFVALGSQQKKLSKKVRSIPGAQVYSA